MRLAPKSTGTQSVSSWFKARRTRSRLVNGAGISLGRRLEDYSLRLLRE